jgi:hypothetical protein
MLLNEIIYHEETKVFSCSVTKKTDLAIRQLILTIVSCFKKPVLVVSVSIPYTRNRGSSQISGKFHMERIDGTFDVEFFAKQKTRSMK